MSECACVCVCLCVLHMCRAEQQQTQRCHCHHASLASLQPPVADDGLRRLPAHPAPPLPTPSCHCLVFTSLSQPNRRLYYFPFVIVLFSYDFPFLLYLFNFFCRLPSPAYAEQSPTPPPCRQLPLCALSFSPFFAVCPSLSPSLFYSLLFGFSFCSLCFKLGTSFAFLSFFLCCFPSIFPFFVCCAAVTFGHHHYHLPTIPVPLLLIIIIIFGCCGRRCCNPSARSVPAIFIVLCTHNFILAHFWVVYFYGYI